MLFTRTFKSVFIFLIVFSLSTSAFAGKSRRIPGYLFYPLIPVASLCGVLLYSGMTMPGPDAPLQEPQITILKSKVSDAELREMLNTKALADIEAKHPGATLVGTPHYMWVSQASVFAPKTMQPIPRTFRQRFVRETPRQTTLTETRWIETSYAYVANLQLPDGKQISYFNLYAHDLEKEKIVETRHFGLFSGREESVKFASEKDPADKALLAVLRSQLLASLLKVEAINRDWPVEEPKATGYKVVPYFDKSDKTKFMVFVTGLQKIFIVTPEADGATVEILVDEPQGNVG